MGTLYLHIGTPKTGTSAIQRFLPLNGELLQEQGFCYPDFGYRYPLVNDNRNGHFLVARQSSKGLSEEETEQLRQSENNRFYEGLDKVKELMETYPNVILSDENVWNGYIKRENFWTVLKDALTERGIDLKVIVYLRRQDSVIESYWLQRVKEKLQTSFEEYIDTGKYNFFKLDYYTQLKEISEVIGKENIIVRAYEKQQYEGNGNSLMSDFLKVLGLELDSRYQYADIVANTRLYGKFLEVKRIFNAMECYQSVNWSVKYLKMVQEEEEAKFGVPNCKYFAYDKQVAFLKEYEESNAAVAREFMNREDGVLFRDEIKKDGDADEKTYSTDELVLICGRMLELMHEEYTDRIEHMREDYTNKIEALKRSLAWAKRPLYRKIGGKIYHIFK